MADNVELDPGTGGAVIAADDIGPGVWHQRVKIQYGTDGSATDVSDTNPLPIDDAGGSITVDGTVTANAGSGPFPVSDNGTTLSVDDGAGSLTVDGSVSLAAAIPAGTNNIGDVDVLTLPALPAGTNNIGDVDVLTLPALPAGTNNIGDVDVASIAAGSNAIGNVGITPRTSGGLSASANLIDIDETEDEIKGTAGQVFGWYIYNDGATEVYVKFYNATAATVVVGTTTPAFTLPIPAGGAANVFTDIGIAFSTAITVAATTGVAVADTGAPAANQVVGTIFYA